MSVKRIYAGIGSRKTPDSVLETMYYGAQQLADLNFTLRSGAAAGADSAFEAGCDMVGGSKEIYLPWKGFQGHSSHLHTPTDEALKMAAKFHPNWGACSYGARKLHARNCHQILGIGLDTPADFVICWTPNGSGSGGTGQALRIAQSHGIPIFDLGAPHGIDHLNLALANYL